MSIKESNQFGRWKHCIHHHPADRKVLFRERGVFYITKLRWKAATRPNEFLHFNCS